MKNVLTITISLVLLLTGTVYGGEWIEDKSSGCKVWNPKPGPNETVTYKGECKNGIANGQGTLTWFKDGQQSGEPETGNYVNGAKIEWGIEFYVDDKFPPDEIIAKRFDNQKKELIL